MAYDQGAIDLSLNKARLGPYVPVADPGWVEKVVTLTAQTIAKKKILIGVPTYGYEYEVTPLSEQGYRFDLQWALNPKYGLDLAEELGITPIRNSAGELSFIYKATSTAPLVPNGGIENTVNNNDMLSATIFTQATMASQIKPPFNVVWWSDAQAIKDKMELAKRLGVRGISIFKLDGGEDPALWDILKK